MVYAEDAVSTEVCTFGTSNVRFPSPSVLRTEPGSGVVLGQLNNPIWMLDVALVTLDVTMESHEIDIDIFYMYHSFLQGFTRREADAKQTRGIT